MVQNAILPDDPRLTAYALGEMEPAERMEFEKYLKQDAAARETVAEIRAAVASLTNALADEPLPVVAEKDLAHAAIIQGKDLRRLDGGLVPPEGFLGRKIKFPHFYYLVSGLAAACFAVFFVYWQQNRPLHEKKRYIEVPLVAAKSTGEPVPVELPVSDVSKDESQSVPALREPHQLGDFAMDKEGKAKAMFAPLESNWSTQPKEREANAEAYAFRKDNDYQRVVDQPLSTFSVDVDTASYANVRRFLVQGQRPPVDAIRIEEMVNYFPYDYAGPQRTESKSEVSGPPFAAHLEVADAPWAPEHRLVRIGLKGREVADAARPAANLVFLLDVSGSMNEPKKLPLVKQSLRLLVGKLRPDDRVALAVYAGASGLALPSTLASHQTEILEAIDRLEAGGSTNGAMGIQLAYDVAKANFVQGGVNRVILATDGDFNVGMSSEGELVRLIQDKARSGVFLSVLGFGTGNIKDATLEQLADKGNGNYAYIDSLAEARKTLVEQAGGTLVTIAKDVKLQVEFNPAVVLAYRLVGYENRLLAKEDFNNDQIDAGEIGAGHTVTALYEVVPVGVEMTPAPGVDPLKYQKPAIAASSRESGASKVEMLTVKIRYKEPTGDVSSKMEFPLYDTGTRFADSTQDFKFASAVAAFGMVLRNSTHKGSATLADVEVWGRAGLGSDGGGYRSEFLGLVERSKALLQ
jgi:Ca-activated chloride channel family protein